jgi:hypothetical protein
MFQLKVKEIIQRIASRGTGSVPEVQHENTLSRFQCKVRNRRYLQTNDQE